MIIGIVQWILISLILIILIHHLFYFLRNTLTVPKVKDLVNQPTEFYKEIEETLKSSDSIPFKIDNNNNDMDKKEMKNELKNFFNELKEKSSDKEILFNNFNSNNVFTQI